MSVKHSRVLIWLGVSIALTFMTVVSTLLGVAAPLLFPRVVTHWLGVLLFFFFGVTLTHKAITAPGSVRMTCFARCTSLALVYGVTHIHILAQHLLTVLRR